MEMPNVLQLLKSPRVSMPPMDFDFLSQPVRPSSARSSGRPQSTRQQGALHAASIAVAPREHGCGHSVELVELRPQSARIRLRTRRRVAAMGDGAYRTLQMPPFLMLPMHRVEARARAPSASYVSRGLMGVPPAAAAAYGFAAPGNRFSGEPHLQPQPQPPRSLHLTQPRQRARASTAIHHHVPPSSPVEPMPWVVPEPPALDLAKFDEPIWRASSDHQARAAVGGGDGGGGGATLVSVGAAAVDAACDAKEVHDAEPFSESDEDSGTCCAKAYKLAMLFICPCMLSNTSSSDMWTALYSHCGKPRGALPLAYARRLY